MRYQSDFFKYSIKKVGESFSIRLRFYWIECVYRLYLKRKSEVKKSKLGNWNYWHFFSVLCFLFFLVRAVKIQNYWNIPNRKILFWVFMLWTFLHPKTGHPETGLQVIRWNLKPIKLQGFCFLKKEERSLKSRMVSGL